MAGATLASAAGFAISALPGEEEKALGGDRGLRFSHEVHVQGQELGCEECHGFGPGERIMPRQAVCELCHETEATSEQSAACADCHTRAENLVEDSPTTLSAEIRFSHEPHLARACSDCHASRRFTAEEMAAGPGSGMTMPTCELCHPGPEAARLPAEPLGEFCFACHERMAASRSECGICHRTITAETAAAHSTAGN